MSLWTRTRKPDVTDEQVEHALDELLKEGHACPSIRKVQARVGGGSFTTISAKLSAIRASQQRRETRLDDFPALFETLLRDTRAAIEHATEARLAERRSQLEAELHDNHERMQEIENELTDALKTIEAQEQRLGDLARSNAELMRSLEAPYQALADARVRCAAAEAESRQLAERLTQAMDLNAALKAQVAQGLESRHQR